MTIYIIYAIYTISTHTSNTPIPTHQETKTILEPIEIIVEYAF